MRNDLCAKAACKTRPILEARCSVQFSEPGGWLASLAPGANGTLIGVTEGDFDFFAGNVFQLTPSGGTWSVRQLWNFNNGPDRNPLGVVAGLDGHLYGTLNGGDSDNGSVFELK
jgi:hypothetical protein